MQTDNRDHIDELIDLYALGMLEPDDQQRSDAHLAACGRCRGLLEDARHVVDVMAFTPEQHDPPPDLRRKVLTRIERLQKTERQAAAYTRRPSLWARLFGSISSLRLIATVAMVLALLLGGQALLLRREIDSLQSEMRTLQPVADLLKQPGVQMIALTKQGDPTTIHGYMLLRPDDREAFLSTAELAPLPQGQTYQLWLINGDQPESAGIFSTDAQGVGYVRVQAQQPLGAYQAVGISVEPAGGSKQPTTTPIVLSQISTGS